MKTHEMPVARIRQVINGWVVTAGTEFLMSSMGERIAASPDEVVTVLKEIWANGIREFLKSLDGEGGSDGKA